MSPFCSVHLTRFFYGSISEFLFSKSLVCSLYDLPQAQDGQIGVRSLIWKGEDRKENALNRRSTFFSVLNHRLPDIIYACPTNPTTWLVLVASTALQILLNGQKPVSKQNALQHLSLLFGTAVEAGLLFAVLQ
jgi:hypothetical protein